MTAKELNEKAKSATLNRQEHEFKRLQEELIMEADNGFFKHSITSWRCADLPLDWKERLISLGFVIKGCTDYTKDELCFIEWSDV